MPRPARSAASARKQPTPLPIAPRDRTPGTINGMSEEHLRFLAESLPEIVWTGLPDGYIDFMNRRWFEFTGLTEKETYEDLKSAVHPDDFLVYKRRWEESVRTLKPYEVQYRFRRASDGMYRWHLGRGLPMFDDKGNVVKWFGTCTDIHAQKTAEKQIRKLNEELESLVLDRTAHLLEEIRQRRKTERKYREHVQLLQRMINTLPMAAVAVDPNGDILYANEQFRLLFCPEENIDSLAGRPCKDVLGIAQVYMTEDAWAHLERKFRTTLGVFREEVSLLDGRTFSIERIPGIESTPQSGYLLLIRDISEEKRIDAVKSNFMSLASHQLRTPLTSIRWALSRLDKQLDERLSGDERQLFKRARQAVGGMAQTITTMLSIARVEAGLRSVNTTEISIRDFLENLRDDFAEECGAKQLKMTMECPADVSLKTDPEVLSEILENLLVNAVKYTPDSGTITLRCSCESDCVTIEVEDTGHGIPAHQHDKVFTKFFRGENIMQIDTQGTGLGLYLVSLLAQSIGAHVRFASEQGKGTTFTVTLPTAC